MAKVPTYTGDQLDKISGSRGRWLKLPNDQDSATIVFIDQPVYWMKHGMKGPCLGDECPLCSSGDRAVGTGGITVFNLKTGDRAIWQRSRSWFRDVYDVMAAKLGKRGKSILDFPFVIQRHGKPMDSKTRYTLEFTDPLAPAPLADDERAVLKGVRAFAVEDIVGRPVQPDESGSDHSEDGDPGPEDEVPF